jgi:hypothetical protein
MQTMQSEDGLSSGTSNEKPIIAAGDASRSGAADVREIIAGSLMAILVFAMLCFAWLMVLSGIARVFGDT